jgi:hypothetical protein
MTIHAFTDQSAPAARPTSTSARASPVQATWSSPCAPRARTAQAPSSSDRDQAVALAHDTPPPLPRACSGRQGRRRPLPRMEAAGDVQPRLRDQLRWPQGRRVEQEQMLARRHELCSAQWRRAPCSSMRCNSPRPELRRFRRSTALPPHQQRVIDEKRELDERLGKAECVLPHGRSSPALWMSAETGAASAAGRCDGDLLRHPGRAHRRVPSRSGLTSLVQQGSRIFA